MAFKKPTIVQTRGFAPTQEQVVNADLVRQGRDVKIIAGAGSGKSSSLRYIGTQVPDKNILVLCFNKANEVESSTHPDRPENVFYSTINAIAYGKVIDAKYRKKLSFLSYRDLEKYNIDEIEGIAQDDVSTATKAVIYAITYYCRSGTDTLDKTVLEYLNYHHSYDRLCVDEETGEIGTRFQDSVIYNLMKIAIDYWEDLVHGSASISHDVYLKLYQLAGHKIDEFYDKGAKRYIKVDILAIDESQDTNMVCEAIFRNQDHLQRIMVGDPMQQLYAWRGGHDIMSLPYYNSFATGYLSQSFRFNQHIADISNFILGKANSKLRLIGSGTKSEITTKAILCRTNARVVEHLLALVENPERKLFTSIDLKSVFSKLYHMESAWFNTKPKYPCKELAHIVDKESLLRAIELSDEIAALNKLRNNLVGEGKTITSVKKTIEAQLVEDMKEADVVISTIHKSKGLEWSYVVISDDFISTKDGETTQDIQERLWKSHTLMCMLYVAVTRAEVDVKLPWYLENMEDEEEYV